MGGACHSAHVTDGSLVNFTDVAKIRHIRCVMGLAKLFRSTFVWGLVLSFPLGFAASYLAGWVSAKAPRLAMSRQSSTVAGRTGTDMTITNIGDFDLVGVSATLRFNASVDFSISPPEWANSAQFTNRVFTLRCPANLKLRPSQEVTVRFTSTGEHGIENEEELPSSVQATVFQPQVISAVWKRREILSNYSLPGFLLALLFIIVVALAVVVVVAVIALRRAGLWFGDPKLSDSPGALGQLRGGHGST
jgi:hypothetical protein